MFYFRINKLRILDNRTSAFLFFKKDLADVKIVSFVTTDNADLPELDAWFRERDPAKKKALLAAAVSGVVASRILTEVDHVKDNQTLTFGDTGYVLYQTTGVPENFNWCFTAVKSKRGTREFGATLAGIVSDPEFDGFSGNLGTLISKAGNPVYEAGVAVAKFVTGTAAKILQASGDDQIGILYMSLNRPQHYVHGERKADDVPDLTGNLIVDYSLFGYEDPKATNGAGKKGKGVKRPKPPTR
jgi:hypothetical protein